MHAEVTAGDGVIWLHRVAPEWGHAKEDGAEIRYEPLDQPYGFREYSAYDSERRLWSFLQPLD